MRRTLGVFLDFLAQVLVAVEEPRIFFVFVQIPAFRAQLVERLVEFNRLSQRCHQVLHHLELGEALHRAGSLREGGHQQQPRDLARRVVVHLVVDDLGVALFAARAGYVVGDRSGEVVDVGQTVPNIGLSQVDVLAADQIDVVELPALDRAHHHGGEGHQAARLPEFLVVLEQSQDVLERRVERVGGGDLAGDLLSGFRDGLRLHRVGDRFGERRRGGIDHRFVGLREQQPGAQDVVDFVGAEFDRGDALGLPAGLLLEGARGALDEASDLRGRPLIASR